MPRRSRVAAEAGASRRNESFGWASLGPRQAHAKVRVVLTHSLMHPDLQQLIQLQEVDSSAERARRRLAELPAAEEALKARAAERAAEVAGVKQRMAVTQAERRELEKELAMLQGRLSKFKGQLMEVKTNKEYQAMQKELAGAEQDIRSHEDRLLDHMEAAESLAAGLKSAEAALKADQTEIAREAQALDAERATIDLDLRQASERRSAIVATVSSEALAIFERIAYGRKGLAVAEARDGLCTVCHVRLRPQVFNEVRRNDAINQCDSCTRILYFKVLKGAEGC